MVLMSSTSRNDIEKAKKCLVPQFNERSSHVDVSRSSEVVGVGASFSYSPLVSFDLPS